MRSNNELLKEVEVLTKLQKELTEVNDHLRLQNLKMRMDFEALLDKDVDKDPKAAAILRGYRNKREHWNEVEKGLRN